VNIAAVYKLPAIFVCENNLYASHMPLLERRAEDNIVKTAAAHGIAGSCVDGNDVIAMYETATPLWRARAGDGPTLIEARTYRWRGHVGPSWDMTSVCCARTSSPNGRHAIRSPAPLRS
jgi:TPP-dependent pyruvate/acetoin dehydrogenase alpha subunit